MNDSASISFSAFVADIRDIIYKGKNTAISSVNSVMIATYWNIGKRIVEEEQQGKSRADYGKRLIEALAYELSNEFGSGFSKRYLAYFRKFYLSFPDLKILQTRLQNLRWSHIITALRVDDVTARRWYLENAASQMWSVRTLNRNISTQYYERHFQTPEATTSNITDSPQACEILKSPFIAVFLGFKQDIAKYSILNGNQQLFATKYKLYMPTEEQLRKEIIHQKELFKLQHQSDAKII